MGEHPAWAVSSERPSLLAFLVAAAGLAGAIAALALPGGTTHSGEIAAVLAVGALALLAGHRWGLLIVVVTDVVLIGSIWPLLVYEFPPSLSAQAAAYTALAGALPGLVLLRRTLPSMVDMIIEPHSPRARRVGLICAGVLCGVGLLVPGLA